jgi:hypothetical protein
MLGLLTRRAGDEMGQKYQHEHGLFPPFCSFILNFVGFVLRPFLSQSEAMAGTAPNLKPMFLAR